MYMDSKCILDFLKKLPISISPIHLSPLSRIFLDKIIHQIHLGQNSWKTNTSYKEHILRPDEFPKDIDFHHIVENIRKEIVTFPKIGKQYSFVIGKRTFTIYAVVPHYSSSKIIAKKVYAYLDEAVKKMYIWLYVASHFAMAECSRELSVYLYLTEHQKRFPSKGVVIDQEHANTAFTRACPIGANEIYIFRREEWFKVFIHETFHSLGLDFAKMPEQIANEALFSIFPVRCDYRFYEAYTETWATIIHTLFLTMETKGAIYPRLESYLNKERLFSLFQKAKLLVHHELKYSHLCSLSTARRYRENTQAFSYFILKCILLFHYNDFIEWCAHKNKGTIVFKRLHGNVLSLVDFIGTKSKDPLYIVALDHMENWFVKTGYKGPEMTTMRMTVLS